MYTRDPGHDYALAVLDGIYDEHSSLRFGKRVGDKYPGNVAPAYSGTTMQEALRAIIDRARYVNGQEACPETEAAIGLLEAAVLLFEVRAKRVKGKTLDGVTLAEIIGGPICKHCLHVKCTEDHTI